LELLPVYLLVMHKGISLRALLLTPPSFPRAALVLAELRLFVAYLKRASDLIILFPGGAGRKERRSRESLTIGFFILVPSDQLIVLSLLKIFVAFSLLFLRLGWLVL